MKKWLGRAFGAPTLEHLVDDLCVRLRRQGWTDIRADVARAGVHASRQGQRMHFALRELFEDYRRAGPLARAALLRGYLRGVPLEADPVPKDYEQARSRLMPLVRTRADVGLGRLQAQGLLQGMQEAVRPVLHRPFLGELVLALGCDLPEATAWVPEDCLASWGRSFEQVWADALLNLRALPEQPGWTPIARGVWSGDWNDGYEASRLLLPDLIHRLGVPEPVVMAPFRNTLLVASGNDPQAVRRMGEAVAEVSSQASGWLSFEPMRLRGRQWVPHEVPRGDRPFFSALREQGRALSYHHQKALIDSQFGPDDTPLHVAEYRHVRREDDSVQSVALWREGVDSLLPVTEWLALLPAGDSRDPILARWQDVRELAGDLLESTDLLPPRVRVRGFPSADVASDLRGRMARADLVQ